MPQSLVPDAAFGLTGEQIYQCTGTVCAAEFQRWAAAVGDLDPVYFDESAARQAGFRTIVMPQLFIAHVCGEATATADLNDDGSNARDPMESLRLPAARLAAGGEACEFSGVAYPGDQITARCTLDALEERSGRSGPFVLATFQWQYRNQDDLLIAAARTTLIVR